MPERQYIGMLCIGDPHLCCRAPGFRRDDYPRAILEKLRWALAYAQAEALLPCLLGDLFHYPRDNANWLLVELMAMLDGTPLAIAGNHDCSENSLGDDDTLSVLFAAGKLQALGEAGASVWRGTMGGVHVAVGGTSWGKALPKHFRENDGQRFVFWITHHDVRFPGYEEAARLDCREIEGIDLLINGHIHRCLADVQAGRTLWCNPGNIARVNRSDASRAHQPSVTRIDVNADGWRITRLPIPHRSFDEVFHEQLIEATEASAIESGFVQGLAALQQVKTSDGQGLREFLDRNVEQFAPHIRQQIRALADSVLNAQAIAPEMDTL